MRSFQKPPDSIPQTTKVESSLGNADSACSHSCWMSCSDLKRMFDIRDTEWVGVSLTWVSRKGPWACQKPAQAFQKQLAPLSPPISAHSTSWTSMRTRQGNKNGFYFILQLLSYKSPQSRIPASSRNSQSIAAGTRQTSMNCPCIVPGQDLE